MNDLYSLIPEAMVRFDFAHYWRDERAILQPALEALGYTHVRFVMGERDSFGPLSRIVLATKDGRSVRLWYA